MNTQKTKQFVEEHGIVAIKADKTDTDHPEEISELLTELGNFGQVLPFYVVYPADGGKPIVFDGVVTQSKLMDKLEQAVPSEPSDSTARTAMKP